MDNSALVEQITFATNGTTVMTTTKAYDHQSRRIQKLVSTNNGSSYVAAFTNRFVYDGWNLIATLNPQLSTINSFMWGLDLSGSEQGAGGVGGLLAVHDPSTINSQPSVHFVAYDGNGNVTSLVNATDGAASASYEYGPFSEVLRATGPMAKANAFRFSTKYQDDETDQLYYGYRSYNPSQGRWLSRDPIEENGGLNVYIHSHNNPINHIDHLGLDIWVIRSTCDYFLGVFDIGHAWVIGSNPDGTYWQSDFRPDTKSGYGLSAAVDAKVRDEAKKRSETPKQPKYDACGNNCRSYAEGMAYFARGSNTREWLDSVGRN